ncbi:MAG TPA: peptide chain release factor N(5)-glutamine methyltransferase [Candidatus Limnocylindrales bacterium]|nr:peptide chain release factor N(5)-glutamine methyltransferase [Candidatus Limnocylindrales bacterium]
MATVGQLLSDAIARLREAGSESARLDAELLLAFVLGTDRTSVLAHPEWAVAPETAAIFVEALDRRAAGEPVAYIRGIKEFFGLAFAADARALIPRPETERLVELGREEVMARLFAAVRNPRSGPVRVADVGTGGGAIAISLAVELRRRNVLLGTEMTILATDASADALDLARENAVAHAVADSIEFVEADLLPSVLPDDARFDVILANLPYVRSGEISGLPIAASFEPHLSLDGGADGLDLIRRLLARLPEVLVTDGVALFEIGSDQEYDGPAAAADVLPGWDASIQDDLAALPRVLRVTRAAAG